MNKVFAPNYPRNEDGIVLFPRDTDLRYLLFPFTDLTEHVAKANMHMVKALVEFVSEVDDVILDPFGGTGTILVGATIGRQVHMIELEEHFQETIEKNIKGVRLSYPGIEDLVNLIPGDCSKVLPIPDFYDHIIFSPPYSNVINKSVKDVEKSQALRELSYANIALYTSNPDNIGRLSDFIYHQKMEKVYRKCYQSVKPGGTMTIIIKDRIENQKRVMLGKRAEKDCIRIGFCPVAWNKHQALGGAFVAIYRSKGLETVDDEDLITLRRPI